MLKVYAEVLPPTLGRGIHRINREMRKAAPPGTVFVTDHRKADIQILDVIGTGSFEYLRLPDSYALLQYCYLTTETQDPEYWVPIFQGAKVVMSYYDLYALTGSIDFDFYRAPLGVDGKVFKPDEQKQRTYLIFTSGYEPAGEPIKECYDAATRLGYGVIHLGPHLDYGRGFMAINDINDATLAGLYSQCWYASGMRFGEGFELPVLEGLACGARPICFDTPGFRYWFNDHAVFVPECSGAELTSHLINVFSCRPTPISAHERAEVLDKFNWTTIFTEFWRRITA